MRRSSKRTEDKNPESLVEIDAFLQPLASSAAVSGKKEKSVPGFVNKLFRYTFRLFTL